MFGQLEELVSAFGPTLVLLLVFFKLGSVVNALAGIKLQLERSQNSERSAPRT